MLIALIIILAIAGYSTNMIFGHKSFFCEYHLKIISQNFFQTFVWSHLNKLLLKGIKRLSSSKEPRNGPFKPIGSTLMNEKHSLDEIDSVIIQQVLGFLKPFELVQISCLNKGLKFVSENDVLWKEKFQKTDYLSVLESSHKDLVKDFIFSGTNCLRGNLHLHNRSNQKLDPSLTWKYNYFLKQHLQPKEILHSFSKWGRIVVLIDSEIYDLTEFAPEHPGGDSILLEYNGADASEGFRHFVHSSYAKKIMRKYLICSSQAILGKRGNLHILPDLLRSYDRLQSSKIIKDRNNPRSHSSGSSSVGFSFRTFGR
mmetsp:Transcript_12923/g.16870  ORF Transcript_12923/g.16870 Transcript_12923/m.16870 type:complete len:313 (+) Transcript_12923:64-1002(+)